MKWTVTVFLPVVLVSGQLAAETKSPPGDIMLLPGYTHERGQGFDSEVGKISKAGGVTIQYDIGDLAGNYTECDSCGWTRGEIWRKKQVVKGQGVTIVYTQEKRLIVTFPGHHANFYATVETAEELAEVLLMVLTYDGSKP